MAKKKSSSNSSLMSMLTSKHHIIPSAMGGGIAFVLTGVAILGAMVFAAVWAGNMLSRHLHKNS